MKPISLRKSKKILIAVYQRWRKKRKKLLPEQSRTIREDLKGLQDAVLSSDRENASTSAHKCAGYLASELKKTGFAAARDFIVALVVALAFALLIRQVWFELYEIPTGSMRPTFKEKDRLIVSKTSFGINIPFTTKHLYFDPELVKRSGSIVFTVADMDVPHSDTMYFWIFPGKKQLVKRMMGKPGDTVYFYGGQMYGIDEKGQSITEELEPTCLQGIDHIPFLQFEGVISTQEPFQTHLGNGYRVSIIHQMNEPVARLTALGNNRFDAEMLFTPQIHNRNSPMPKNMYELWGIGNYAKTRIINRDGAKSFAEKNGMELGGYTHFLELKHHPNLYDVEMARDYQNRIRPQFVLETSLIPLSKEHLQKIFSSMYTSRFVVRNELATQYRAEGCAPPSHSLIKLPNVPDGTYEFFNGIAYQIQWQGVTKRLGKDHPLSQFSEALTLSLYNFGVDFDKRQGIGQRFDTQRFTYYRNGDLYVLGSPIFTQSDPILQAFVAEEGKRQSEAKNPGSYIPFLDEGAPMKPDGSIDGEKIRQYGLLIPPQSYLALGDNFSISGDSRIFGFVPAGNLRGAPSFIFWPFGSRFGPPNQPPYPWVTLPNIVIWSLAFICLFLWYPYHRRHQHLPLKDL